MTTTQRDATPAIATFAIRPFRVDVPEADLVDLRQRIVATRWPDRETVADASQGVQHDTRALARYCATEYDWRAVEARLNALPRSMTQIDGLDVHFIHVTSRHADALPLIVTHGWPGSIIEQLKIIEPLTTIEVLAMLDLTPIVYVVDDDVSVRESLESLIKYAGWRPELFASAQEFLSRPRPTVPSCMVLDVTLPGLNGLDLQQQLADRTDMPIIFITGYGDVPMTVRAMKAGAVEFLTKPFQDDVLLTAVRDAIERSRAALRLDAEMRTLRHDYESLTPREREVMALVVAGLLNKQVAGELGISEITVKAHRGHVMRKMKADSLPDLVTMAARLGLRATPKA